VGASRVPELCGKSRGGLAGERKEGGEGGVVSEVLNGLCGLRHGCRAMRWWERVRAATTPVAAASE
jgi:hypothetical protein